VQRGGAEPDHSHEDLDVDVVVEHHLELLPVQHPSELRVAAARLRVLRDSCLNVLRPVIYLRTEAIVDLMESEKHGDVLSRQRGSQKGPDHFLHQVLPRRADQFADHREDRMHAATAVLPVRKLVDSTDRGERHQQVEDDAEHEFCGLDDAKPVLLRPVYQRLPFERDGARDGHRMGRILRQLRHASDWHTVSAEEMRL